MDGDKQDEMISGGFDHKIYVLDAEGKELWQYNVEGLPLSIAVEDVSGDGRKDIITGSMDSKGTLYALDYKKGVLWTYLPEQPLLCVATGDIDGDGKNEIVGGSFGGMIYVLNGKGKLKWKKYINKRTSIGSMAVGDIIGDKKQEIVLGTRNKGIYALNKDGDIIWRLKSVVKGNRGDKWARTIVIEDIDMDGKNEVIVGSRPSGMVTVLNGVGAVIWRRNFPEIVNKWSTGQIAVGNMVGDKKKEIACLLQGTIKKGRKGTSPIFVLDPTGKPISQCFPEKNFFSLTAGNVDNDPYAEVLLSSSTRGHYFYRVDVAVLGGQIVSPLFNHERDNIDVLLDTVKHQKVHVEAAKESVAPSPKIHILYPYAISEKTSFEKLTNFLRSLESQNLCFELMLTSIYEKQESIEPKKRGKYLTQEEILSIIRVYEARGMPFYVLAGKDARLRMRLDTLQKILKNAPKSCKGFIVNENNYGLGRRFETFIQDVSAILDMLLRHGEKKLILDENLDYWIKVPTIPGMAKKIFNEKFRNVLVPMYKTNRVVVPELNMGMILGLWKAGIVKQWGFCAQEDLWKFESIYMNPPHDVLLRKEVMAASLGATYFRIEENRDFIEEKNQTWVMSEGGKRCRGLFHSLVRNGVVRPIDTADHVLISPVMFQMKYRKSQMPKRHEKMEEYWQNIYRLEGPFAYKFPLEVVREDYVPSYLYRLDHYYDGLFPKTDYGFVAMVPDSVDPLKVKGINDYWIVDAQRVCAKDGKTIVKGQEKKTLLDSFRKYVSYLPFKAKGAVISINKIGDEYLVYLIDPGHFDIKDTETVLEMNVKADKVKIIDAVSGQVLPYKDKMVHINIPAGLFRILRIVPREEQVSPKDPYESGS